MRWVGALAVGALGVTPAPVSGDSFTPVRMQISIAGVARLHQPLTVKVSVSADKDVLDRRVGPVRARVKLTAGECGGDYDHSTGVVLLDRALTPQPDPSEVYQGATAGSGRPTAYGVQAVCAYLEDSDNRQFANDTTDYQVNVSKPCTDAAARYDRALAALRRAQRALSHAHGSASRSHLQHVVSQRRTSASSAKRAAAAACGPGVPL